MMLYQTKKLFHRKGNYKQDEKDVYWMGEYICNWYTLWCTKYKNNAYNIKKTQLKMGWGPVCIFLKMTYRWQ